MRKNMAKIHQKHASVRPDTDRGAPLEPGENLKAKVKSIFIFVKYYNAFRGCYLKFAKLQYVSSGFRCRVITGSLMRLY